MSHFPFIIILLLPLLLSPTTAKCLPSQSAALLRLKQHFRFTHRSASNLTSWISTADCCSWEGVACAPLSSGMVTVLNLSNLAIAGKLDISLFNLTALASLNLAYNNFNPSPFPQFFNLLPNLTRLNLSNAGFTGQIPASIASLTGLVSLDLSTFYLDEVPGYALKLHDPELRKLIQNLRGLRELYLDGVNISANGTQWGRAVAESAPGLHELSLVGCSLSGPIDSSLTVLRSLKLLRLNQNSLNCGVPDFVGNFTSMIQLSLSSCALKGGVPDTIFKIRSLTVLDVSTNPALSGSLPEFLSSSLESLVLSNTNLSGSLPESIGSLSSLARLELSNCSFHGQLPHTMMNLTQLAYLDLSFNNFSGEIPSILLWERIIELVLANNSLNGSIPVSLGRKLTKIDLENNLLTGSIPSSLFSLPSLNVLQVKQNRLTGQIRNFPNASQKLSMVDLSGNNLQGEIPSSVFNLTGLEILGLSSNNFSGAIDLSLFASLQNLTSLDLSNNRLSVTTSNSTLSFPKLDTLRLAACNLTSIPSLLRNQTKISSLDLSNNRISGFIPSWIWGFPGLIYLNLSSNLFTDVMRPLAELSNTTTPIILDLHSNKLQGPIPLPPTYTIVLDYSNNNFISTIPVNISLYLKYTIFFSLSNNNLTGAIPPSICEASNLKVLDLGLNKLTSSIPPCLIGNISTLQILNLRNNQLSGTIPYASLQQCSLHTVNLNGNQLSGKFPPTLANCTMIEVLDLGNNRFHDTFPHWLSGFSQLQVLVLSGNSFYGAIGDLNFPMLQIFDISSNKFSGTLSSDCFSSFKSMMGGSSPATVSHPALGISYLKFSRVGFYQDAVSVTYKGREMTFVNVLSMLTYIDLSDNGFVGGIPETIGELTWLIMLNVSHNSFTGRIPSWLGGLVELEALDLSSNRLTGEIPQELVSLTFLAVLNLSDNELAGKIPQAGQLSTFDSNAFEGNDGLCGMPLAKSCSIVVPPNVVPPNVSRVEVGSPTSWESVVIGVGIGAGLAVVLGGLRVCDEWRQRFEECVDGMMWAVTGSMWWCWGGVRVSAAEGEEEVEQRYCVFCTKLEVRDGVLVLRHRECGCPKRGP